MPLFETIEQEEIKSNNIFDEYNYDSFVEENNKKLDAQKQEHNLWVQNIVSPEKIAEWQKMGTMSALEVWNRKEKNELVPYMSTIQQADKGLRIKKISDNMQKGLYVSPEDKAFYEQFVLDMAEIQTRGYTFGGKAVNAGMETLPFMLEFGAGLLTTGGAASLGASAAKFGVKGAIKKATSEALEGASKKIAEDGILKAAGKGIGKVAYDATLNPKTYAFAATRLPQQVKARYADIMLSDSLAISEEGQAILLEAKEKPATAFLKALGMTNIEVASEMAGMTLFKPVGGALGRFVNQKVMSKLPEKFATRFTKVAEEITGMPFVKGVEALGFNGLVEEMGEERVGDILRYAFDLDEEKGYTFEQLLDAAFPSVEQLAVEAVTFGVMGVGAGLVDAGLKKVSKKYSKDEFLIDAGVLRSADSDSLLDAKTRERLQQAGVAEEDIETALQFGTREQKIDFINNNASAQSELAQEIEADWYNKLVESGAQHDVAYQSAKLMSVFADRYGKNTEMFKKWYDKLAVTNKPIEEGKKIAAGKAQYQAAASAGANENEIAEAEKEWKEKGTESKYFKKWFGDSKVVDENGKPLVVYHGTNAEFDTFSTDYENEGRMLGDGVYLTRYIDKANNYGGNLMKLYVSLQNPLNINAENVLQIIGKQAKISKKVIQDWLRYYDGNTQQTISRLFREYNVADKLKEKGYDGIIYNNGLEIVAFNPEQIKSVDNRGTFDANNPNIYYQNIFGEVWNAIFELLKFKHGQKAEEIFDKVPALAPLKEYFGESIKGIEIKKMPKWLKSTSKDFGGYLRWNKTIYINDDYMKQFANKRQQFVRTVLHELVHAKQEYLYKYAKKNLKNKDFTKQEKDYLKQYIELYEKSDKDTKEFKDFINKYNEKDLKNNKQLEAEYKRVYNKYINAHKEMDADNVALALQSIIGESDNKLIKRYANDFKITERSAQASRTKEIADIRAFVQRNNGTFAKYGRLSEQVDTTVYYQSAFHGTPHRFDEFLLDHIGSGEGAQVHGWGLYFAGNKDVSEGYRKKLTTFGLRKKVENVTLNGEIVKDAHKATLLIGIKNTDKQNVIERIERDLKNTKRHQNEAEKEDKNAYQVIIDNLSEDLKFIENIEENQIEIEYLKGQLFEVDIPENDVLLDEDLTFNKQPEKVKEALKNLPIQFFDINDYDIEEMTGGDIYGEIVNNIAKRDGYKSAQKEFEKNASKLLNKHGIKGITYDGRQDGRCYVIFDDKAIKVLNTFYQEGGQYSLYSDADISDKLARLWAEWNGTSYVDIKEGEKASKLYEQINILEDYLENRTKASVVDSIMSGDANYSPKVKTEEGEINNNFHDMLNRVREKKEAQENEYYGYFIESEDKNVLSIMQNHDPSTVIHEMGHLFLNGLNEFAKIDEEAAEQLAAVNKWLGSDGVYTVAQQEKFARSFEAYLYRGKAPSNILRKVFEAFKEWMKKIYLDVGKIPQADISDETIELFDRLFYGNEYVEKNKQIKQLVNRIKTLKDNDELTDFQKRHRDVAYNIVALATGKDENYLKRILEAKKPSKSVQKQQENIELLLDKTDDKISTKNGFIPEWLEFFTEAELYEDEAKLARAAYDTIISGSYKAGNFEEDYLNYAEEQYKFIIKEFEKRTDERDIVLGAYYEWLSTINEEYQELFGEKFLADTAYIERRENMDKFEIAKEDILQAAKAANNPYSINTVEAYKDVVLSIMKGLDFLQPADKAKLTTNILENTSVALLEARIDNILDIAKTMEDLSYRRDLVKKIREELQGTKNVKQGARTVGKYDYKTNKLFEKLREYDNLSVEQANDIRLSEEKLAQAEEEGLSFEDKMINRFLTFKANGNTYGTTENIKALYDDIVKIKIAAKEAKTEQEMFDKLNVEKDVQELVDIVNAKKEPKVAQYYVQLLGNWESTLNALFNKNIKDKYSLLIAETEADVWIYQQKKKFEIEIAKIYGLNSWNFDKELLKGLTEKYTFAERVRDYDKDFNLVRERLVDKTMNRLEILLAYIWNKNELMRKRLINMFGEDTLDSMFEILSPEDMKLGDYMVKMASSYYPDVNEAFIKKYGLDLPKISAYFPSRAEREGSEVDMFNDFTSQTKNDSFTKNRTKSETIALEFGNPIEMLYSHIDGVGKFIYMGAALDKVNKVFKNKALKRIIKNKYDDKTYTSLLHTLTNVTYKASPSVYSLHTKILNNVISNWIQGNVIFRPIVGLKQLLSANNYATDMPYLEWTAGFLKALSNPAKTIDYMMKIPYLEARFKGSMTNEFLKDTINNSAFAASKRFKDFLSLNIKLGDIGAIIFGGKPYIDYLIKKGMTEEQAIEEFILSTQRTQQSSAISSLGNFQVAMGRNPIGKLFTAYKNSPYQYMRMCADAIISVANGDMTLRQCAKVIYQYAYVQPLLYTLATSGSIFVFAATGDDDDLKKDMFRTLFNLNADALALIGDIYKFAIDKLIMKEKYMPATTPMLGDLEMEIMKLSKKDVELKDYLSAAGLGIHIATGVDANAVGNSIAGIGDIAKGDVAKGSLRAIGYTENRAKYIVGEKQKKKK